MPKEGFMWTNDGKSAKREWKDCRLIGSTGYNRTFGVVRVIGKPKKDGLNVCRHSQRIHYMKHT